MTENGLQLRTRDPADPLVVSGVEVPAGSRTRVDLPSGNLSSGTPVSLPIEIVRGRRPGPHVWLSSGIHGDELNGIEVIRRVLGSLRPAQVGGAVFAAPIVNVYGFISRSRYLPDRRDLNRSFPGSPRGSLASRLAHLFMTEIVDHCDVGIDLHTGSDHRTNLPQLRADLDDPATRTLARAFAPPVMVHSATRDGSLRAAAAGLSIPILVFEGGEPNRFDSEAIEVAVAGVLRVLGELGVAGSPARSAPPEPMEVRHTRWVRAGRAGILRLSAQPGQKVRKGEQLGFIADSFGARPLSVRSPMEAVVLGVTRNPIVNRGDAVANLGRVERGEKTPSP
jgi:predicted deacylase